MALAVVPGWFVILIMSVVKIRLENVERHEYGLFYTPHKGKMRDSIMKHFRGYSLFLLGINLVVTEWDIFCLLFYSIMRNYVHHLVSLDMAHSS